MVKGGWDAMGREGWKGCEGMDGMIWEGMNGRDVKGWMG